MHSKLFIDDSPGISVSEMRAKARRLKQTEGLDLLIVDYLQLMSAVPIGGKRFENRTQEVSAISRGLKALAKELKVPVVALSQLSRAPESRGGDHRAATFRPARIGLHRAGRRRGRLHLPRRGVQEGRSRPRGQGRNHRRQTAQRSHRRLSRWPSSSTLRGLRTSRRRTSTTRECRDTSACTPANWAKAKCDWDPTPLGA